MGNGERIPNQGQVNLKLEAGNGEDEVNNISTTFQVARVTRPLMSVSRICDTGLTATFDKEKAVVRDARGRTVCIFKRQGGLYVSRMKPKAPGKTPLQGQGR